MFISKPSSAGAECDIFSIFPLELHEKSDTSPFLNSEQVNSGVPATSLLHEQSEL